MKLVEYEGFEFQVGENANDNWDILKKTFIKTHAEQRMSIDAKNGLDAFKRKKEPDWT